VNRLRIVHTTGFHYGGEITASYNEARMLPVTTADQLVLHSHLDIHPVSAQAAYRDYWGTQVSSFEVLTSHTSLSLTATSLVEVRPSRHPEHALGWEELAVLAQRAVSTVEQLGQTRRTAPAEDLAQKAREIASGHEDACSAARAVCEYVGSSMEYVQGVTGVQTTAAEAWQLRKGVCQDIAHAALGALRAIGIPARYVSGYLHPRREPAVGELVKGESHAWVEWFCGDWRGYDPTNLIDIGDRHVRVGHGRDYGDVAPLRGVYSGSSASSLFVTVEITREA